MKSLLSESRSVRIILKISFTQSERETFFIFITKKETCGRCVAYINTYIYLAWSYTCKFSHLPCILNIFAGFLLSRFKREVEKKDKLLSFWRRGSTCYFIFGSFFLLRLRIKFLEIFTNFYQVLRILSYILYIIFS